MSNVISLDAYRNRIAFDGRALVWCGLKHNLTATEATRLAEALNEARVFAGQWSAAGFLLESDGVEVKITGWDMGPVFLRTPGQAAKLTLDLAQVGS